MLEILLPELEEELVLGCTGRAVVKVSPAILVDCRAGSDRAGCQQCGE